MKLHENQLKLVRHLARFTLLEYTDCLDMLNTEGTLERTALSYIFRPLTKNKYISKRKDGCVSILAKGRTLFPEVTPLISAGGGTSERCYLCAERKQGSRQPEASSVRPCGAAASFFRKAAWSATGPYGGPGHPSS